MASYSGLAGTIFVYKIAGALADRGGDVDEVYSLANWVASRLATIGVSLGHTRVSRLLLFSQSLS
jgi:dihydroxyacetone kinase